uniref:Protein tyrosine phosphatase 4a1 n=1 Tax=Mus musculus TaxID=10090 RepID=A0A5F8MQ01_MOUSE
MVVWCPRRLHPRRRPATPTAACPAAAACAASGPAV